MMCWHLMIMTRKARRTGTMTMSQSTTRSQLAICWVRHMMKIHRMARKKRWKRKKSLLIGAVPCSSLGIGGKRSLLTRLPRHGGSTNLLPAVTEPLLQVCQFRPRLQLQCLQQRQCQQLCLKQSPLSLRQLQVQPSHLCQHRSSTLQQVLSFRHQLQLQLQLRRSRWLLQSHRELLRLQLWQVHQFPHQHRFGSLRTAVASGSIDGEAICEGGAHGALGNLGQIAARLVVVVRKFATEPTRSGYIALTSRAESDSNSQSAQTTSAGTGKSATARSARPHPQRLQARPQLPQPAQQPQRPPQRLPPPLPRPPQPHLQHLQLRMEGDGAAKVLKMVGEGTSGDGVVWLSQILSQTKRQRRKPMKEKTTRPTRRRHRRWMPTQT
mmetsp:Transcript_23028/g.42417  ORF Transcript_23028/g.42417 Transcript_23028/m.42417 type:complete len:381 (+) Transcript_23028:291-1433(+)